MSSPKLDRTHGKNHWKPRPRFPIRAILLLTAVVALACSVMLVIAKIRTAELEEALRAREAAKRNYYQAEQRRLRNIQMGPTKIRVIASDTKEAVPGVILETTLIGPDGGDGGFETTLTNNDGFAHLHPSLSPGRYQIDLVPDPDSRFADKDWNRGELYLQIMPDGSCSIRILELDPK